MKVGLSKVDVFKEVLAAVGYAGGVAYIVTAYAGLPAEVPVHYGLLGMPDAWAPRPMVWVFPAIGTFVYASLTLGQFFGRPNLPWATTRKNRERIYRVTRELIWWLKVQIMWMMAYMQYMEVEVAQHRASGLGHYFAPAFAGMPFLTLGVYFYIAYRIAQQR